jgi:hypothetical protein
MIVQEPDKLRDSQAYVWPCHKVLISENPIIKDEGERESLTQTLPSLLLSFQVRLPVWCACMHKQMHKQVHKQVLPLKRMRIKYVKRNAHSDQAGRCRDRSV